MNYGQQTSAPYQRASVLKHPRTDYALCTIDYALLTMHYGLAFSING